MNKIVGDFTFAAFIIWEIATGNQSYLTALKLGWGASAMMLFVSNDTLHRTETNSTTSQLPS